MTRPAALVPLSILLGKPEPEARARALLARYPAFHLARVEPSALVATGIVSPREAARIEAAFALGGEALVPPASEPVTSSEQAARSVPELRYAPVEELWIIALDGARRPLLRMRVARGKRNRCDVDPGDVVSAVLRANAAGFYALHNHPSGDPRPSPEDLAFTESLVLACELLGLSLYDHIVIGGDAWMSCVERGSRGRLVARPETTKDEDSVRDADRDGDVALRAAERRHRDARERRLHARLKRWASAHLGPDGDAREAPRRHRKADVGARE